MRAVLASLLALGVSGCAVVPAVATFGGIGAGIACFRNPDCGSTAAVTACGENPMLLESGTNVVMLPFRTSGDGQVDKDVDNIASTLQLSTMASLAPLDGVKVIRLTENDKHPGRCEPQKVEADWSGCSRQTGRPLLIAREPVLLLWANTFHDKDKVFFQYNVGMWRVRQTATIELNFSQIGVGSQRFVATVPIRQVAFGTRALSMGDLAELRQAFAETRLHSTPERAAGTVQIGLEETDGGGDLRSLRNREGLWVRIRSADGTAGWLPLADHKQLRKRFPELHFVDAATGYFEYLRNPQPEKGKFAIEAFQRFVRENEGRADERGAVAVGAALIGVVALLDGLKTRDREALDNAGELLRIAHEIFPKNGDIRNLQLLADFTRCCVNLAQSRVDTDRLTLEVEQTRLDSEWLASAYIDMRDSIAAEPTNDDSVLNAIQLLSLLEKNGVHEVRRNNELEKVAEVRGKLERTLVPGKRQSSFAACQPGS